MTPSRAPTWDAPGTFEVAPGVHRIPLPLPGDGLRAVNVYAIEDGPGVALVDAGSFRPGSLAALEAGLSAIGASPADITAVLATHGHYDHYGLATRLRALSGAPVLLGERERTLIDIATDGDAFTRWMDERRAWLEHHGAGALLPAVERFDRHERLDASRDEGRWEAPNRWLADGETVALNRRQLTVHWTPGHTRGHIVYEDSAHRLLFAGDHVLGHITPSIGFEPIADGRALELYLGSLSRVRDMAVDLALPGHGYPIESLASRVDELLAHHRARLDGCLGSVGRRGTASAADVAGDLTWTRRERALSDLDGFNQMLAVSETVAHLELLVTDGRLQREIRPDGDLTYLPAAA